MYLLFTYIHKINNAAVTYFLKVVTIFLKLTLYVLAGIKTSCALTCGPLRLNYIFLAYCVPNFQMISGPYGPIFLNVVCIARKLADLVNLLYVQQILQIDQLVRPLEVFPNSIFQANWQ